MTQATINLAQWLDIITPLNKKLAKLRFAAPITHTTNPLDYALAAHTEFIRRYGLTTKRVVFLGMNPGPFGMAQTGIPFGEVAAVRDWLHIDGVRHAPQKPANENPARPVEGFACHRAEVSGKRLWGLFAKRFGQAEHFFAEHFVINYCPLIFYVGGRNFTPDKLPQIERQHLLALCDQSLREMIMLLQPECVIGVGKWAEQRARVALDVAQAKQLPNLQFGQILHPSPASPAANRGWAEQAEAQLVAQGLW